MASRRRLLDNILATCLWAILICILIFDYSLIFNITGTEPYVVSDGYVWTKQAKISWDKIIDFIPNKNNHGCYRLFTGNASTRLKLLEKPFKKYQKYIEKIKEETLDSDEEITTNSTYIQSKLIKAYQRLARLKWVKTVCQIGFRHGRTALAWLTAKQGIIVHIFEGDLRGKAEGRSKLVKELFKKRYFLHTGSLLSSWIDVLKGNCDLLYIDGGHELAQKVTDYLYLARFAAKKHIIISNHLQYPLVNRTWNLLIGLGMVSERYRCYVNNENIDLVIGNYAGLFWRDQPKKK